MKVVNFYTGIGFSGAEHLNEVTYTDEEFASLSEEDLYEICEEYAQEYLEAWYEVQEN